MLIQQNEKPINVPVINPGSIGKAPTTATGTIVLCPGQGAQHVGMGKAWAERSPAAAETFALADRLLGESLTDLCFQGPEEKLNRTDWAQVAIYVASVASFRGLRAAGQLGDVVAYAGLSLGEFTALHLAGAYSFEVGLELVRLRGRAMQEAAEAVPSGMVALIGADEPQARTLCDMVLTSLSAADQVLVPANFNAPGQVVISGTKRACERAIELATAQGLQAKPLAVAGAFHSPLMRPAAERLAAALDRVAWNPPAVPVLSNVTAAPHRSEDIDSIKRRLVEQLTHPVRWAESVEWMLRQVPDGRYVELAPNKVLAGLMRRIDRKRRVDNFAEPPA